MPIPVEEQIPLYIRLNKLKYPDAKVKVDQWVEQQYKTFLKIRQPNKQYWFFNLTGTDIFE